MLVSFQGTCLPLIKLFMGKLKVVAGNWINRDHHNYLKGHPLTQAQHTGRPRQQDHVSLSLRSGHIARLHIRKGLEESLV